MDMHSCIFYHRSTGPQTVFVFILRLSVQPFSGLVSEAASPSISLHLSSGAADICPLLWIFNKVRSPTPWHLRKILIFPLRTWGFSFEFCVSSIFQSRHQRRWSTCLYFPRELSLSFCSDTLGILISCRQLFQIFQPRYPCGDIVGFSFPVSLCPRGSIILGWTAPFLRAMSWEVFSLTSYFVVLRGRRSYSS